MDSTEPNFMGMAPPGTEGPYETIVFGAFFASSAAVLLLTLLIYT